MIIGTWARLTFGGPFWRSTCDVCDKWFEWTWNEHVVSLTIPVWCCCYSTVAMLSIRHIMEFPLHASPHFSKCKYLIALFIYLWWVWSGEYQPFVVCVRCFLFSVCARWWLFWRVLVRRCINSLSTKILHWTSYRCLSLPTASGTGQLREKFFRSTRRCLWQGGRRCNNPKWKGAKDLRSRRQLGSVRQWLYFFFEVTRWRRTSVALRHLLQHLLQHLRQHLWEVDGPLYLYDRAVSFLKHPLLALYRLAGPIQSLPVESCRSAAI